MHVFLRFMLVGHTWCVPSQSAVVSWRKVWWFFTCPVKSWQNTSTSWSWADWTSAQNHVPSAACLLPWRVVANRRPPRVNISIRSDFSLAVHFVVTMWNSVSKLWIRMTLFAKRLSWVSKLSVYLFKYFSQIQCTKCQFVWCFKCHAPWHEGLKCRDYRKGDKLLRHWASVFEHGQRNAQKCPRCKVMNMLYKNALYIYWKVDFHLIFWHGKVITLCTVIQCS